MATSLVVRVNTSANDVAYASAPADFTTVDTANDAIIASKGSDVVADGEAIPSETDLNQAGELITSSIVTVSKYFLKDVSAGILREIHNAGNQNKRYVFCASFDGATASEPVLEMWDDSDMDSTALKCLGDGTPANSWFKGIVTTDALPGSNWTGSALAGSGTGRFLWLNNGAGVGALSGAKDLYFNLKIQIPANYTSSGIENPIAVIKYTTN